MDPFYELYKNAGLIPIEIGINGIESLICCVGTCLNFSLVYVTVKTNDLHRPCNILIALYAFFISFLLLGNTIKFFVFLLGINYISLRACYFIQIVPLVCTNFGINLQLCIGIDRLIGVLCPFWYKGHGKYILFKLFTFINLLETIFSKYIQYNGARLHWEQPVMCAFGEPLNQPETADFTNTRTRVIYTAELLCYAIIWTIVFCKKSSQVSSKNKRLMLSLSVIMAMGLFNGLLNLLSHIILPHLNLDIFTIEYVATPILITLYLIFNSSITPILFLYSKLYSKAFRECFRRTNAVT